MKLLRAIGGYGIGIYILMVLTLTLMGVVTWP